MTHHADGLVHVTVVEDDERRLPSQLQRNLLQVTERTAVFGKSVNKQTNKKHVTVIRMYKQQKLSLCLLLPLHDLFADRSGAGEAQLTDVWVVGQTLSHHAPWRKGNVESCGAG